MVRCRDAFASAMRALVAIDEPLRRRIADAFLCLVCWDAVRSGDPLPTGVREWLDDVKTRIARSAEPGPLSHRIRRWAEALSLGEAREVAQRFVDAFAEVMHTAGR